MFYKSISEVYDYIFPQNRNQLIFLESIKEIGIDEKILDIGCATGNLTRLLSERSNNVSGIDLDRHLLDKAEEKYSDQDICFTKLNMLDIKKIFAKDSFDRVVSFGNTLVHLPKREDVKDFFNQVFFLLNPGGVFSFQIINYDRIRKYNIKKLQTINNDKIKFVREYNYHVDGSYVDFKTELTIKEVNTIINNNIPLLALTREEILLYLNESGFINIKFYGDLGGGELLDTSVPLLVSCIKE